MKQIFRETGIHAERQADTGCRHTGSLIQTQKGQIVRLRLGNEIDIQNKDRQHKETDRLIQHYTDREKSS